MIMKDIRKIINNYFDGNLSKEEEDALKEFVLKHDLTSEYSFLKDMFEHFEKEKQISLPQDFEDNLFVKINEIESRENKVKRVVSYAITGIAACLIIFIGVFYYSQLSNNKSDELSRALVEDEELNTTYEAFLLMNYYIGKGFSSIEELNKLSIAPNEIQKLEILYEYKSKFLNNK